MSFRVGSRSFGYKVVDKESLVGGEGMIDASIWCVLREGIEVGICGLRFLVKEGALSQGPYMVLVIGFAEEDGYV